MKSGYKSLGIAILLVLAFGTRVMADDLTGRIEWVFDQVLNVQLGGPPGTEHGDHFKPDNVATSNRIITTLKDFIGANTSTFPLSSTSTGMTFEFLGGVPVASHTSAGPIFADRARTIGGGRLNVGVNLSYLNLSRLRGIRTEDVWFSFLHEDVGEPGMGDSENEYDYITLDMNLNVDATVFALYGTYGITENLDVGLSVPMVAVTLSAGPVAEMTSFTYVKNDSANHFFGGTSQEPVLSSTPASINQTAFGVGDIALRGKYSFRHGHGVDLAGQIEVRLPTGREEDFLGVGSTSIRTSLIGSTTWGNIAPHFNVGYDRRTSDTEDDELELTVGFDQKVVEELTLAVDWLGEYEVGGAIEELQFPEPTSIGPFTGEGQFVVETVPSTNIPNFSHDHIVRTSFGFKYTPRQNVIITGNILVPLNSGGLRSDFIPTVGFELYY